jgi:hypothetical protein
MNRDAAKDEPPADADRWHVRTELGTRGAPFAQWVWWRGDRYLPARWRSLIDGEHLPYTAELVCTADTAGPRCEAITFHAREGSEAISPRRLRAMPAGALIELAVFSAAQRGEHQPGHQRIRFGGDIGDASDELRNVRPSRERGNEAHLREVADVYRAAERYPTRAVQDHFACPSYNTAAHWVAKARAAQLIPPAKRGRSTAGKREQ